MNESIIDIIESNKKTLRAEYQKGYIIGFKEGEKRAISEFLQNWKWGKVFEIHWKSRNFWKRCRCKNLPGSYWNWFEKKLEQRLKEVGL